LNPNPGSPVQSCRKFSAVLGTISCRSSIMMRPAGLPPMVMSKYTFVNLPSKSAAGGGGASAASELEPQPIFAESEFERDRKGFSVEWLSISLQSGKVMACYGDGVITSTSKDLRSECLTFLCDLRMLLQCQCCLYQYVSPQYCEYTLQTSNTTKVTMLLSHVVTFGKSTM
jgi:hypothetical protein